MGEDEIKLVRKKLKWNYEPFKIPKELLSEWRKIGEKSSIKAEKQNSKSKKIFDDYENINSLKSLIEKTKNEYLENLKPIATRKSSEMFLDIASQLPNLIGGSADLAGSNNTKTKNLSLIHI